MAVAVQPTKEVETKNKPHTKQKRVVVTGMGVVSPLGHETDVFYNNLLEGVSGVSQIEAFDCAQFSSVIDCFNTSFLLFVALNKFYRAQFPTVIGYSNTSFLLFVALNKFYRHKFHFSLYHRELLGKSSLSRLMDGFHQNWLGEWINSCFICLLLVKKLWQMVEFLRM